MGDFDCCGCCSAEPYLDPIPWVSGRNVRYGTDDIYFGSTPLEFRPREADQLGKPFSQDRADYGVSS